MGEEINSLQQKIFQAHTLFLFIISSKLLTLFNPSHNPLVLHNLHAFFGVHISQFGFYTISSLIFHFFRVHPQIANNFIDL